MAIFDLLERHVKTGIAHMLRPDLGIMDPDNTITLPRMVAACTGWDVLCHAIESLTALPYSQRPAPDNPGLRPAYQGATRSAMCGRARAIEMVSANLVGVRTAEDDEVRSQMLLAAAFAGIGFGNAGVHLPARHVVPGVGRGAALRGGGLSDGRPLVPLGMAVILNTHM